MTLFDTSIWVAHLKNPGGHAGLIEALESGVAWTHPFVEGELLLAGAPTDVLFAGVESLAVAPHVEVVDFVRLLAPPVPGVGWVDLHLLYGALAHGLQLETLDRRLAGLRDGVTQG